MSTNAEDRAYCITRIAAATKLALASPDSCARVAHAGTASAYRKRLTRLKSAATDATSAHQRRAPVRDDRAADQG